MSLDSSRPIHEQLQEQEDSLINLSEARILLVEDNLLIQEVMMTILEDMGMKVDVASNGEEAVQSVSFKSYDAILMDLQMPVMDGYEAARNIRKLDRGWKTPIIAVTADALDEIKEQVIEAGMYMCISKTFAPIELYKVLQRVMQASKQQSSKQDNRQLIDFRIEHADTMDWIRYAIRKGEINNALSLTFALKDAALAIGATELVTAIAKLEHALLNELDPAFALTIAKNKFTEVLSSIERIEARS